jgi:hypothetical protein
MHRTTEDSELYTLGFEVGSDGQSIRTCTYDSDVTLGHDLFPLLRSAGANGVSRWDYYTEILNVMAVIPVPEEFRLRQSMQLFMQIASSRLCAGNLGRL